MRQSSTLVMIVALSTGLITTCAVPENETRTAQQTSTPAASPSPASPAAELDRALGVTAGFSPTYKVLKVEDVSTATASRKVVHVSLPKGVGR